MIELNHIVEFLESLKQNILDLETKIQNKIDDASGEAWHEGFHAGFESGYNTFKEHGKINDEDFQYYLDKAKNKAMEK